MKRKQYFAGIDGEMKAEQWLVQQGQSVIAKRYRADDGEIDLVMRDGDVLAFVEVKYRPNSFKGDGIACVTPSKQKRIGHAAACFIMEKEMAGWQIRFDVIEITREGVLYIPNAFSPIDFYF